MKPNDPNFSLPPQQVSVDVLLEKYAKADEKPELGRGGWRGFCGAGRWEISRRLERRWTAKLAVGARAHVDHLGNLAALDRLPLRGTEIRRAGEGRLWQAPARAAGAAPGRGFGSGAGSVSPIAASGAAGEPAARYARHRTDSSHTRPHAGRSASSRLGWRFEVMWKAREKR